MAVGFGTAQPKPESRKRSKARKDRAEAKVKKSVRAIVDQRDGFCRLFSYAEDINRFFGACDGVSEWAHLEEQRRYNTRGMAPDKRHTTIGSVKFCTRHHRAYDAHIFSIQWLTPFGADGPLKYKQGLSQFVEPHRPKCLLWRVCSIWRSA